MIPNTHMIIDNVHKILSHQILNLDLNSPKWDISTNQPGKNGSFDLRILFLLFMRQKYSLGLNHNKFT